MARHNAQMTGTSHPKNYTFDRETFVSLLFREDLEGPWTDIGLHELPPEEKEGLELLLTASGMIDDPDFDSSRVLLVRSVDGIIDGVYGPAIFRDGERMVLKCGGNTTEVTQEGDKLIAGELKGRINLRVEKDATEREYPVAECSFRANGAIVTVKLSLDTDNAGVSYVALQAAILNEEPILPFLLHVPSAAIAMHQLGVGEYGVKSVSYIPDGRYGDGYKLHLFNGATVWAKGNSLLQLASGIVPAPENPVTLRIVRIAEVSEGRFAIDNQLVLRAPRTTDGNSLVDVRAVPVIEASHEADEEPDDIPFARPVLNFGELHDGWEVEADRPGSWLRGNRAFYRETM